MSKSADDYMWDVIEALKRGWSCKSVAISYLKHELEKAKVNGWEADIKRFEDNLKMLEDKTEE